MPNRNRGPSTRHRSGPALKTSSPTSAVRSRDARFQQWRALLDNRVKRTRTGEFLVHGVRPITVAVEQGWPLAALLRPQGATRSGWANDVIARVADNTDVAVIDVAPDLLRELGEKDESAPELLAVARLRPDRLDRIAFGPDGLVVAFDRPASPGNLGTLIRSADAFGASGVVVTGHAADVYDPRAVRASTGSLFAVPTVRCDSQRDVVAWIDDLRKRGTPVQIVGTDEDGRLDVDEVDLTGPCLLVIGNEQRGMSTAWRDACDLTVRIPIAGAASSLNASVAGSLVCYEASRQRRRAGSVSQPDRT